MNLDVIVTRPYKSYTDDQLRSHQVDVVTATYDEPAYAGVQLQAEEVKIAGVEFTTACTNAAYGGTTLISTKNSKRAVLLEKLDNLGTALQLTVKDDLTYITNAHFSVKQQGQRSTEPLPDPVLDFVQRGVLEGTVDGKVKALPKGVKAIAVEYSADGGLTWQNGTYSTGLKFSLSGLDSRKEYRVRVRYHGTFQRTSNPSVEMPVFVL